MGVDEITLLKDYGPAALSVVGSILAFLLSVIWASLIFFWKAQKRRMNKLERQLDALGDKMEKGMAAASADHGRIKEAMMGYRAEVHLLKISVEPLKAGLLSLEGAVKNQNVTINAYVEKMGVISGKLDAVFRFIDASVKRGTDITTM